LDKNLKKKVNISCPAVWDFDTFLKLHSPNQSKCWAEYEFFLNQESGEFDFWVVLEQLDKPTKLKVKKGNVFFVTMEEKDVSPSFSDKYIKQFDWVITSRDDIKHKKQIKSHYFTKWHIGKSYDELMASIDSPPIKTKDLSAIISSRVQYGTHLKRYAFINKLKGHFKNRLDWYSKNENPIDDKWFGLADYRYSICLENGSHSKYFTEKIVDVILSDTIPIYWGAPDIDDYFDKNLVVKIPLEDFEKSIEIIENELSGDKYEARINLLKEAKLKILNEYQFLPWLVKILGENKSDNTNYSSVNLINQDYKTISQRLKGYLTRILKKLID
jgi:hypothetical protein